MLCPNECVRSVTEIDLPRLWEQGLRGLILDVDNTLLAWEADDLPQEVIEWADAARSQGFRLCIASNGVKSRVRAIADRLNVPAISKAVKPRKRPFRKALELMGLPAGQAAVVGDQLFTDVLGGNRLDMYTILINPVSRNELRTTRLVRRVERRVISRLSKKGLLSPGAAKIRNIL